MPTVRVFVAAGLVLLVVVASASAPVLLPLAVLLDLLLIAAFVADLHRARATVVTARRTWPPLLVQGAPATVTVRVRAARAVRVRLRDALHPGLADAPRRRELEIPAGAVAEWTYGLEPRRRGEHLAGPLTARVMGPWGLAWAQRDAAAPETCRVYPRVRWGGRVGRVLALARRRQLGRTAVRLRGMGAEIYGLREYEPGDPPSRIHWKATARHGRLITREETMERGGRLVVLLDCARAMASFDAGRSKLDHALAAALALTRVAAAHGDHVTLVAFAARVERVVPVRPSARSIAGAYHALYDVEARLVEPDYEAAAAAARRAEPRRATIVVLTSAVDLAAVGALNDTLGRLARRYRVILVNLEDPELADLAHGEPATAAEAFAKAAALEILLGNRRLARRLRRSGIRAVDAPADRLAWGAIEAWLAGRGSRTVRAAAGAPGMAARY